MIVLLATALGDSQPPRKGGAQAACRGGRETVRDGKECGSRTQQLLLKKLGVGIEPPNLLLKSRATW